MPWAQKDFAIEPDATDKVQLLLRLNDVRIGDVSAESLIDLVRDYRLAYSQFYRNGLGLQRDGIQMGLVEIDEFVKDPTDLKSRLANPEGGTYSDLELAFLIASKVVCKSKTAARIFGTLATKRNREKVSSRIESLRWA